MLPQPSAESDKYRRGVLGLVAGSEQYTGAAVLSTGGAIHGGAGHGPADFGRTRDRGSSASTGPRRCSPTYDPGHPEQAIETAGRVQAWAAGPGIGTGPEAAALLAAVLASDLPVLVDADGITVLAGAS